MNDGIRSMVVVCRVARGRVPLFPPGTVSIADDAIRCTFDPRWRGLLGRDLVHRTREVTMVHSRLIPGPWRVLLEIVGERGDRVCATPNLGWTNAVRDELAARGYTVVDRTSWVL